VTTAAPSTVNHHPTPAPRQIGRDLLTGNADTVYFFAFLDLSQGPVVVEVPPECLGAVNDMWLRWVTDVGVPGPDRGAGGAYLLVPPGYTGLLPEGGTFIARSPTHRPSARIEVCSPRSAIFAVMPRTSRSS
jgi:hypothetical protein